MLTFGLLLGVMTLPKTIVTFILVLGLLIFVHELGHYLVAKWVGVRVEEFALGFGPKLVGFRKGETQYSLRVFPLGGFCKMTGEFPHAEEELEGEELIEYKDAVSQGRALYQKSVLQRFGVIFTGPLMNFVLAALLYTLVFTIAGVPMADVGSPVPQIGAILQDSPAEAAGLKANDLVKQIENQPVDEFDDITRIINEEKAEKLTFLIERDGQEQRLTIEPRVAEDGRRVIGIYPLAVYEKVGFVRATGYAVEQTWNFMKLIVVGFWQMITRQVPADVGGPVMIAKMVGEAAEIGWVYLVHLTALISINLGIINLVPFPALDGGRILFLGVELVRGKAVDPEKEGFVHFIGFVILMALIVVILYRDIVTIF